MPDVEAIRRYLLAQGLLGHAITGATVLWPRAVRSGPAEEFVLALSGRRIRALARRAKFLLVRLDRASSREARPPSPQPAQSGLTLIIHLRMTGSLLVEPAGQPRPPYTHTVFSLDDRRELRFRDPRKLGVLWLVQDESTVLSGLGPEPLDPAFTPQALAGRLAGRSAPIKALLCDQAVVAGIGNIYADELLFLGGLHPLRRAGGLTAEEVERLHQAMVQRLSEATEKLARVVPGGGPPTESQGGLETLLVTRREGAPCTRCDSHVRRLVLRGRGAYFCPRCQAFENPHMPADSSAKSMARIDSSGRVC